MPKRRNTSWSRNKKEKQIITTRLIEISLKVENCIYKHVPISVCEAEQYMREVSSYKLNCHGDERSLQNHPFDIGHGMWYPQAPALFPNGNSGAYISRSSWNYAVIEKLTRCMKAIILDHQDMGTDDPTIQNASNFADDVERADSNSTVYSIPDEDRALTQITEASPLNVTQDVEIIDLSNIDDNDLMPNDTGPTAADYAGSRITVEVDIHREMSSLSLRDAGDPLEITSTDVNCSQSILNDFEGIEQVQQNKISVFQGSVDKGLMSSVTDKGKTIQTGGNTAIAKITNKNTTSITELNKVMITSTDRNKSTVTTLPNTEKRYRTLQNKEPLKEIHIYNNLTTTLNYKETMDTISSQTFHPTINKDPEIQKQTWYDSNRTCTINESCQILKDANTTKPTNIYKGANPVSITNKGNWNVNMPPNTFNSAGKENLNKITEHSKPPVQNRSISNTAEAVVTEIPTATKKKRGPRKKKVVDDKEIKPKNKRLYRGSKSNEENIVKPEKNKILSIYNENVINDLSWVENIRYVREIQADEIDSKLNLEESFWDNYYLPANWSENEFM